MFKRVITLLVGSFLSVAAMAQTAPLAASSWEAGKHYFVIDPPQPTASRDKIEVIEVFSYGCPHCAEFQPIADKIRAALPANATWDYMPAEFQPTWSVFARAFYTAQALGILEKTHKPLFNAIYVDHKVNPKLTGIEELTDFYSGYAVKAEDFLATAKSFAIETHLKRAKALIKAYAVDGTPTIVVNGKYRITGGSAGSYENLMAIVHYLVAQENIQHKSVK